MSASSARSTVLAAVALVVTFVVGIVVGVTGDRIVLWRRPDRMLRPPVTSFMVKRLDQQLNLTPQQEVEVTRILQKHQERMSAVWSNIHPQLRNEIEVTNVEIRRVLTPEQRAKFEGLKMRLQMQRQERHGIRDRRD